MYHSTMNKNLLKTVVEENRSGQKVGLYSACSANELVIRAVIRHAALNKYPVIIESTSNQVNQMGGYTGLQPHEFSRQVKNIAAEENLPPSNLILGGDHLGPLPWLGEAEEKAMENAAFLVSSYVLAGYSKIHLDTSMKLADDPPGPLEVRTCARRAVKLAKVVYESFSTLKNQSPSQDQLIRPTLVIGSEVPIPGGSQTHEDGVIPTEPQDFLKQVSVFKDEFEKAGLDFNDVAAFVVQPGVEFGDDFVCFYDPEKATALTKALKTVNALVFEGHSTDYQGPENLSNMVRDGIAFLKVGPALTFALREGLLLCEAVEEILNPPGSRSNFKKVLLEEMNQSRKHWEKYYFGSDKEIEYKKLFSYSDRCRYYFPEKKVNAAIEVLLKNIQAVPPALISQFFPGQYRKYMAGKLKNDPVSLLCDRVGEICDDYAFSCGYQ